MVYSWALAALAVAPASAQRGIVGTHRTGALLQTWGAELDKAGATPVTRVVNLLKEMTQTLKKEMDEDEELYEKLECWCNTGKYEKEEAIEAGTAKVDQLTAANEGGLAKSKELKERIKQLTQQIANDKQELAKAQKQRDDDVQKFQGFETDSIQGVGNMKAALTVLSKHHESAFPQLSFLQMDPQDARDERSLEGLMQSSGMLEADDVVKTSDRSTSKFLQAEYPAVQKDWSDDEVAVVRKAMKSASAFAQVHNAYEPAYQSQSGEIVGIIKQMLETMEAELKEEQEKESKAAAAFDEMRTAKTASIEAAEKMEEEKEAEKADTDNLIAEAKEDLGATEAQLIEDKTYLKNLNKMCSQGDEAFEKRKASRLEEIKAVTETIEILTGDEARDAMSGTYNFLEVASHQNSRRARAAALLRQAGIRNHNNQLTMLATGVELDAFTKVKKAIDDMIAMLKQQQADEVKKNDYCNKALQENEMTTMKTEDLRDDQNAKVGSLESAIVTLNKEITEAKASVQEANMDLQRASQDRQVENLDFQKTIADQTVTIEILHKAMNRLAEFYDSVEFLQRHKQTPPVAQAEYKPNAGAGGVISMIEKLIYDCKDLMAKAKEGEGEAQTAYETLVADTNASVDKLTKEVATKTEEVAKAKKDLINTQSDLEDTIEELEGLAKYNADLHAECDYVMKNFGARQKGRGDEITSLQEAKQILDGANLGF